MDAKTTGIVAYLTWIGFLVAYLAGDKEGAKFHLNQGLILAIASLALTVITSITAFIPIIGWIISIVAYIADVLILVLMIIGIINAVNGEEKPLPVIGGIQILK